MVNGVEYFENEINGLYDKSLSETKPISQYARF
jgi:hypothetical protein